MTITRRNLLTAAGASALAAIRPPTAYARNDGVIELNAGPSRQRLYAADGPLSDLWTYNGRAPGPQIRVRRGERVRVRFKNNLEEPTSVHWHGMRIANAMDGPVFDPARDLTLVIDDWRLTRAGAFDVASLGAMMDWSHAGRPAPGNRPWTGPL